MTGGAADRIGPGSHPTRLGTNRIHLHHSGPCNRDKGAEALHQARVLAGTNWVTGSHVVGTTLTIASTLFLLIATIVYFQQARALARLKGIEPPWLPLALLISLLVVLLGGALSTLMLIWA